MGDFDGKTILLGVAGGIAAYKAAAIASLLVKSGARVEVVMTEAAREFVGPLTFSAITHAPVHTEVFAPWGPDFSGHVTLADMADLLIVAPATAMIVARIALGLTDDLLGLVALSTNAPLLLAPAMEERMYRHPATQAHLSALSSRGISLVGPEHGRLASGASGSGRMAEPEIIVERAAKLLGRTGPLLGRHVVVTAGGTREPLDPVRFLGNRSSGKMGYALAAAAHEAGATVTLISGPSSLRPPAGPALIRVETALDMQRAVEAATVDADVLIMAAAVADFRPAQRFERKIKKERGSDLFELRLTKNPDILATLDRPGLLKIGFAAETDDLLENASRKLVEKGLAMIVANDAESTIGSEESSATLLVPGEPPAVLPRMSKAALAHEIVGRSAALLARDESHGS